MLHVEQLAKILSGHHHLMSTWSYASDIHLEYHLQKPWPEIESCAPYLALAGDIGHPRDKSYHAFMQYFIINELKFYFHYISMFMFIYVFHFICS